MTLRPIYVDVCHVPAQACVCPGVSTHLWAARGLRVPVCAQYATSVPRCAKCVACPCVPICARGCHVYLCAHLRSLTPRECPRCPRPRCRCRCRSGPLGSAAARGAERGGGGERRRQPPPTSKLSLTRQHRQRRLRAWHGTGIGTGTGSGPDAAGRRPRGTTWCGRRGRAAAWAR